MTEVWFYHLERSAAEPVVAELLEKTLARGWRAVVRGPDRGVLESLDKALWDWRPESFLAHGFDDDADAPRQPILLTDGEGRANAAEAVFLLDGAPTGDLDAYQRCMAVFDGGDAEAVERARALWKASLAAGRDVSYWRQGESGWRKQG